MPTHLTFHDDLAAPERVQVICGKSYAAVSNQDVAMRFSLSSCMCDTFFSNVSHHLARNESCSNQVLVDTLCQQLV